MKKSGKCPKCESREILIVKGNLSDSNSIVLGGTVFSRIPVTHTVCADCGYIEMWIDQEDLPYIKKEKQKRDNRSPFWK